jgi:hypothetical protein
MKPARCSTCVAREQFQIGAIVQENVIIPHNLVLAIIAKEDLDHEGASEEDIYKAIWGAFGACIVSPGRLPLATARPGEQAGFGTELGPHKEPTITLLSASVAHPEDDVNGAIALYS